MLTRLSHEQLNRGHQILGRIIQILLTLHAIFYLNFFILNGLLAKRTRDRDVIIGLTCISILTTLGTTAIGFLRSWNYRVFYTVHVVGATALLPLLFFHVHHIRPFIIESAAVLLLNVVLRTWNTRKYSGTLSVLPGTNLVQVTVPLSGPTKRWRPGQHVYLHPPSSSDSKLPSRLRTNPFTIASLPKKDGQLVLVARTLNGNTRSLASLARSVEIAGRDDSIPLTIEGPYGISVYLPDFATFDRIILVAGGVGATFIVPLWRHILDSRRNGHMPKDGDIRFIWSVRKLAETSWAFPPHARAKVAGADGEEKEVYVTGVKGGIANGSSDTIELAETDTLVDADDERQLLDQGIVVKHNRPDLREIVDEAFSGHVGKVAVLVCGPVGMGRQLRHEVGRWVKRGKDIYYHAEIFGF
jgi:ferredoxin-NADP reductase